MIKVSDLESSTRAVRFLFAAALCGCGPAAEGDPAPGAGLLPEPGLSTTTSIEVSNLGSFTCDFRIPSTFPASSLGPVIERDRMYMAARPGFLTKHIPVLPNDQGDFLTGGRYLFDSAEDAEEYKEWIFNSYYLDGVEFFQRPYFLDVECHSFQALHVYAQGDIHTDDIVLRTERFSLPSGTPVSALQNKWSAILAEGQSRGFTQVWMLYNPTESLASLVYMAPHEAPPAPGVLDAVSLQDLATSTPLGHNFDDYGWTRTFDRTQFVLTIWFPFVPGDHGEPAVWPNSPPLPAPYCGDGVCEPSRGESGTSCSIDCPAQCGDTQCEAGEDTSSCPGDCRI